MDKNEAIRLREKIYSEFSETDILERLTDKTTQFEKTKVLVNLITERKEEISNNYFKDNYDEITSEIHDPNEVSIHELRVESNWNNDSLLCRLCCELATVNNLTANFYPDFLDPEDLKDVIPGFSEGYQFYYNYLNTDEFINEFETFLKIGDLFNVKTLTIAIFQIEEEGIKYFLNELRRTPIYFHQRDSNKNFFNWCKNRVTHSKPHKERFLEFLQVSLSRAKKMEAKTKEIENRFPEPLLEWGGRVGELGYIFKELIAKDFIVFGSAQPSVIAHILTQIFKRADGKGTEWNINSLVNNLNGTKRPSNYQEFEIPKSKNA